MVSSRDDEILEYQTFTTISRFLVAVSGLSFYEWLITSGREIDYIWARKWTVSTWIFVCIRYATVLDSITQIWPASNYRLPLVNAVWRSLDDSSAYGARRNTWVFLVVFGLSIVPAFVNTVTFAQNGIMFAFVSPNNVCQPLLGHSQIGKAIVHILIVQILMKVCLVSYISRTSVIVGDVLALSVTWWKTLGIVREATRLKIKVPLGMVLIREGTLLSLGLLILNIFQLLSVDIRSLENGNPGIAFLLPLSSILVCRFMLNLKAAAYRPAPCSTLHISTIRFNAQALIGNLGEPLEPAADDDEHAMEARSLEVVW